MAKTCDISWFCVPRVPPAVWQHRRAMGLCGHCGLNTHNTAQCCKPTVVMLYPQTWLYRLILSDWVLSDKLWIRWAFPAGRTTLADECRQCVGGSLQ